MGIVPVKALIKRVKITIQSLGNLFILKHPLGPRLVMHCLASLFYSSKTEKSHKRRHVLLFGFQMVRMLHTQTHLVVVFLFSHRA